jgi:hypothetical protein
MRSKTSILYFFLAIIIAALLIAVILKTTIFRSSLNSIMPAFKTVDINNAPLNRNTFLGKLSIFQFMDMRDPSDLYFANMLMESEFINDINLFIIVKGPIIEINPLNHRSPSNVHISNDSLLFSNTFNNIFTKNAFIVFDESGKAILFGKSTDRFDCKGKILLLNKLRAKYFSISDLVPLKKNLNEISWLSFLRPYLNNAHTEYLVVALFNRVCSSCSGGPLIEKLNGLHSSKKNKVRFVSILSNSYNKIDIENLYQTNIFNHTVVLADDYLSFKWNNLIKEYCDILFSDIVFLVSKDGTILKIASIDCDNCYDNLFKYISQL